jgi:hypothetical protein
MTNSNSGDMISLIKKICVSPRFIGSEGSLHAREIITSRLQKAGYKYTLFFTVAPKWSINGLPTIQFLAPEKIKINEIPAIFSPPTTSEGIEGKIIDAGHLTMLESFDWERYAIISTNEEILGYLISTSYGAQMQPLPPEAYTLPHVILDSNTLKKLQSWIQSGLEIYTRVINPTIMAGNVDVISIVTEEPSVKPYILICAHYDTVFGSEGAHDNGSGAAVALKLAGELASLNIPCRFAFFDGEEVNKAGSRPFVADEKGRGALENISLVLEIDAVGIGNEIALLCSKKLYKKLKKLRDHVMNEFLVNYKISISRQSKIGFSDVWPFMEEGIPVIRMLTRGSIAADIMHTSNDTIDKIEEETLLAAFNVAQAITTKLGVGNE